jgi:hypothetical protein
MLVETDSWVPSFQANVLHSCMVHMSEELYHSELLCRTGASALHSSGTNAYKSIVPINAHEPVLNACPLPLDSKNLHFPLRNGTSDRLQDLLVRSMGIELFEGDLLGGRMVANSFSQ